MYSCFLCDNRSFSEISSLKIHIRSSHCTSNILSFKCKQLNCHRRFGSLRSMYKHLRLNHAIVSKNVIALSPGNDIRISFQESDHDSDNPNEEASSRSFYSVAELEYILKLYGNIKFTRSDIIDIINNTAELINASPLNLAVYQCSILNIKLNKYY